jgi:3D (Asp-Asp-Asp) domain-containing protein
MHEHPSSPQGTAKSARRSSHARIFGFGASVLASSALVGIGIATGREAASSSQSSTVLRAAPDEEFAQTSVARASVAARAPTPPRITAPAEPPPERTRVFDGRPLRAVRTMSMRVTAYSPDERSCGIHADGITASGYSVETNGGALVAADPRVLPLGSLVSVPGYDDGAVVPVLDVGGAIKGARLDVLFPTHERAVQWGVRELEVTVWEYADGEPNGFRRQRRPSR